MAMHPRERRSGLWTPRPSRLTGYDRREFLRRSARTALTVPSAAALLAACGGDETSTTTNANGSNTTWPQVAGIDLSRPDHPVELPLKGSAIADDLPIEKGPLKIYNWQDYANPDMLEKFESEFDVKIEWTSFAGMDEAVRKLDTGAVNFDLFFPTIDRIATLVAKGYLQPLNLNYIPNLNNVWPELQDPFYDRGSRYSIPYVLWSDGIGWRSDLVDKTPDDYDNGWDMLWDPAFEGKIWVLDDDRDTLAMPIVRMGRVDDVNTEDRALLEQALDALREINGVQISAESYQKVADGSSPIHATWSGDMLSAPGYLPDGVDATTLRFWDQPDGRGVIGSDAVSIMAGAENPVLAHAFLNFILDTDNALLNMTWNGYQAPLNDIVADKLIADEFIPANLSAAVVEQADFEAGRQLMQLTPVAEKLWDDIFAEFKAG